MSAATKAADEAFPGVEAVDSLALQALRDAYKLGFEAGQRAERNKERGGPREAEEVFLTWEGSRLRIGETADDWRRKSIGKVTRIFQAYKGARWQVEAELNGVKTVHKASDLRKPR